MEHKPLARTVLSRWRHARLIGLGDRANPVSFTPGLCLTDNDPKAGVEIAPFTIEHDSSSLPATLSMNARGPWAYPIERVMCRLTKELKAIHYHRVCKRLILVKGRVRAPFFPSPGSVWSTILLYLMRSYHQKLSSSKMRYSWPAIQAGWYRPFVSYASASLQP